MSFQVEIVKSPKSKLGEGPHWHEETKSLYYVDIYGGSILRYDSKINETFEAKIEGEKIIGFIIPVSNSKNKFAIGLMRRVGIIEWDGKSKQAKLLKIILEVENHVKYENRINDAKVDPYGRLYFGTMRIEDLSAGNTIGRCYF